MLIEMSKIDLSKEPIREAYDQTEINKLMNSIEKVGLITPICLKALGNDRYEILAGNKRYYACKKLGFIDIEAIVVEPKNQYEEYLYSLHENIIREDLTWLEKIMGNKKEKELYEQVYPDAMKWGGDRKSKGRDVPFEPSFTEIKAKIEGKTERAIRADIELAEEIEKHPELGAEQTKGAAISKLKKLKLENKLKGVGDMGKLEIMRKRNENAKLIRFTNRNHRNCIRFSQAESLEHLLEKAKICYNLSAEEKEFYTEAIFENGCRGDIFVLDDSRIIEICCSEEVEDCKKKVNKYPVSNIEYIKI